MTILSLNTLPYNKDQVEKDVGPEAERQWTWFTQQLELAAKENRKVIPITHIYAGSRFKHGETGEVSRLWTKEDTHRYFDLMLAYKDTVMVELAGHDHWADLRAYQESDDLAYRSLHVAPGISVNHGQMPGFSTVKIDSERLVAKDLE